MHKTKKIVIALAGVIALVCATSFGVNAYFTSISKQHTEFQLVKIDTEIKEEIDLNDKKEIKVANVGSADCYVRVRLTVSPVELVNEGVLTLDEYNDASWYEEAVDLDGDSYPDYYNYYYLSVLRSGETTDYLHKGYLFDSEKYAQLGLSDSTIDVSAYEESVQVIVPINENEDPIVSIKKSFAIYDENK